MKIDLKNLTEKIENQDYIQDLETVKYAEISKSKTKLKSYAKKMVDETVAALKHDSLVQVQLAVSGQRPVTFALETNIINLPYSNYKKISNFFEEDQDYPVKVYFETISEFVNASGFRIDQLATEDEILADPDKFVDQMTDWMQEKLTTVREYQKPEKKMTTKTKATKTKTKSKK